MLVLPTGHPILDTVVGILALVGVIGPVLVGLIIVALD